MSDSGTMTDTDTHIDQPADVVATDAEVTDSTPLETAQEETEYYVDVDADQTETASEDETAKYRAIARDKAEKMKRQREAKEEAERKNKELQERLDKQDRLIAELMAGKKPNPDDYYDDPEAYRLAVSEWEQKTPKTTEPAKAQAQNNVLTDDILEEVFVSEERLKEAMPDYDAKAEALTHKLVNKGANADAAMTHLKLLCFRDGVDYAKAVVGINEVPGMFDKVMSAPTEAHLSRYIKDAASKVKTRERKKIDTKPEPVISSGGAVNGSQAEIDRLRKKYSESGSMADFRALQAAKQKVANNG